MKFESKYNNFHGKHIFQNVARKMSTILSHLTLEQNDRHFTDYFWIHFLEWQLFYFDSSCTEFCKHPYHYSFCLRSTMFWNILLSFKIKIKIKVWFKTLLTHWPSQREVFVQGGIDSHIWVTWYRRYKYTVLGPREQSSWGQHGAHLGPVGPRWAPCWPNEHCYQGCSRL